MIDSVKNNFFKNYKYFVRDIYASFSYSIKLLKDCFIINFMFYVYKYNGCYENYNLNILTKTKFWSRLYCRE